MTDHYKILQIDPAADEDVIRAAYQRIISKFHPDKNPSPEAQQRAQAVNEAYRVLSDPDQRAKYNQERPTASTLEADLRRMRELRSQERSRREEAETALRLAQHEALLFKNKALEEQQSAYSKLEELTRRLTDEEQRRHEAEAARAVLEKAEALRQSFGLHVTEKKTASRIRALAWFGGGASAATAAFLYGNLALPTNQHEALEPEMLAVNGGCYEMGSLEVEAERSHFESPKHQACVKSFHIGKYEVTFDEYDRYARATGQALPEDNGWGRGKRPVINVTWHDATAYAGWLSQQTGKLYRLPSEAEWEYAARAGTSAIFSTGECVNTKLANYDGRTRYSQYTDKTASYAGQTKEVGGFPANAWGLHDLLGNVWEWTADCWHDSYQRAPSQGSAWEGPEIACEARVVRGGAWNSGPSSLRSAARYYWNATQHYADTGFRLVQE
jgi:formylglycine-generating enzyme required for sulfatase activity